MKIECEYEVLKTSKGLFEYCPAVLGRFLRGSTAGNRGRGALGEACRDGGCRTNLGPVTCRGQPLFLLHMIVMLLRLEVSCGK